MQIVVLLLKELEINHLTQEEVSKYGSIRRSPSYQVVRKRGLGKEVEEVLNFCQSKVKGKTFEKAIDCVRKYLEVIEDAYLDKEVVRKGAEKVIADCGLLNNPSLTEQELDDYEGHGEYFSYCEKLMKEIFRTTSAEDREEKILETKGDLHKEVEPLREKIKQRREEKVKLLGKLDE
jgi:hypothetical protein